ncbi:hypothetical protein L218DRAFT_1008139 [Marasmius fiardii PR-910]|nr:hypothetical protein L218DRAFT_1008139 [Marasmius fiardii PR-910]
MPTRRPHLKPNPNNGLFVAPDPESDDFKPSPDDGYPYGDTTRLRRDTLQLKPSGYSVNWCDTTFPQPYISTSELLSNLSPNQRKIIVEEPENFILLRPLAGGAVYLDTEDFKKAPDHILEWLHTNVNFPGDKGNLSHPLKKHQPLPLVM